MTATYRVTFADDGRIGRSRGNGPLDLTVRDASHLAELIYGAARPRCLSRDLEVSVECGDDDVPRSGHVFAGVQVAAKFTVESVSA